MKKSKNNEKQKKNVFIINIVFQNFKLKSLFYKKFFKYRKTNKLAENICFKTFF